MALGSLAQTLYNLADAFWLGKLGRNALSAPIISFFIVFFPVSTSMSVNVPMSLRLANFISSSTFFPCLFPNIENMGYFVMPFAPAKSINPMFGSWSIHVPPIIWIFGNAIRVSAITPAW